MSIHAKQPSHPEPGRRHSAAVLAARLVLYWERLWPFVLAVAAPVFLLAILALFGVLAVVPNWAHWSALAAALVASAYAAARYRKDLAFPSRAEALRRLETDGRLRHAPLRALEDRPFAEDSRNPLWRAHQADMARRAEAARLNGPRAADARDALGLRFMAVGLLAVALVAAGSEREARLASLFHPQYAPPPGSQLVDLWIEPPGYTGKAPAFLVRAGNASSTEDKQINVPEGSRVLAQGAGLSRLLFSTAEGVTKSEADGALHSLTLNESGLLRARMKGGELRWAVGVAEDAPPRAHFIEPPAATDDARLAIAVFIDDDYGVADAKLVFSLDPDQSRPLDAPPFDEGSVRAERVVELKGLAGATGERRFDLDLQSDPWAGLSVVGRIVVKDGAGKIGTTEDATFALPAKPFFNPLARAVIEQRQTLAVAAEEWRRAGRSFDALTLAPDRFYAKPTDYLLLRTAFWRVMREGREENFTDSVAEFWPLALQLEDEALELARRRLDAAREALRQALEQGASDNEIAQRVEELREAMRQYLQALAQSGQRMAEEGGRPSQTLSEEDLESMLDSIRDLSQSGAQNAARQALSDLENLLDNLRMSSGAAGGSGQGQSQSGEGQGGGAGAAGDLIGRQRDLSNRAFERGTQPGANGDDLATEERSLRRDLNSLLDEMQQDGADPTGEAARAFSEALDDMELAEDALRAGDFGAADTAMENVIANLREGAAELAQQEARQAREGQSGPSVDPLGRPVGDNAAGDVNVPEANDYQRTRDVLDELRRRLSDGERSEDEIDYLERLLKRF